MLSFLRIEWPDGFITENQLRDWIHHPWHHSTHFVLVEGEMLVSHVSVLWKDLEHVGTVYRRMS
ncbi:MAG TPA: hypothetical protein VGR22_08075 [Thermomicrobiales bacterium]|nr:hypothetical protein [Thermomicrobiales bacterium]